MIFKFLYKLYIFNNKNKLKMYAFNKITFIDIKIN